MRISTYTLGILAASGDTNAKAAMLTQQRFSIRGQTSGVLYDIVTDRFKVRLMEPQAA